MQAQRLHHGAAPDVAGQSEQPFQRLVDEPHSFVAVEQQHAFDHAVEKGQLLRLRLGERVLLLFLQAGVLPGLFREFFPCLINATFPLEMQRDKPEAGENGQGRPHAFSRPGCLTI